MHLLVICCIHQNVRCLFAILNFDSWCRLGLGEITGDQLNEKKTVLNLKYTAIYAIFLVL